MSTDTAQTCPHCGRTLDDDQTQGVCSSDDCPGALKLTETELALLRSLRDRGCAVCVFMPHEIGNASLEDVKLSDTTPIQINWLVATCEGWEPGKYMMSPDIRKNVNGKVIGIMVPINREYIWFKPATNWDQGGPIIEREKIGSLHEARGVWSASTKWDDPTKVFYGMTKLIAAMRCFIASRLGDEVKVPDELC